MISCTFFSSFQNHNYTEDDAVDYVSNPINTYVMLKRTAVHWPRVKAKVIKINLPMQNSMVKWHNVIYADLGHLLGQFKFSEWELRVNSHSTLSLNWLN